MNRAPTARKLSYPVGKRNLYRCILIGKMCVAVRSIGINGTTPCIMDGLVSYFVADGDITPTDWMFETD